MPDYTTPTNLSDHLQRVAEKPSAELTEADIARWRMTFGSMPFGAGLDITHDPKTFADVTLVLGRLAARLSGHGDQHNTLVKDHADLCRDVEAMRRVLGTGGA